MLEEKKDKFLVSSQRAWTLIISAYFHISLKKNVNLIVLPFQSPLEKKWSSILLALSYRFRIIYFKYFF